MAELKAQGLLNIPRGSGHREIRLHDQLTIRVITEEARVIKAGAQGYHGIPWAFLFTAANTKRIGQPIVNC
ncbi:MAG: hypothetical protein C4293_10905 [Nitrospiraceae bacterium]